MSLKWSPGCQCCGGVALPCEVFLLDSSDFPIDPTTVGFSTDYVGSYPTNASHLVIPANSYLEYDTAIDTTGLRFLLQPESFSRIDSDLEIVIVDSGGDEVVAVRQTANDTMRMVADGNNVDFRMDSTDGSNTLWLNFSPFHELIITQLMMQTSRISASNNDGFYFYTNTPTVTRLTDNLEITTDVDWHLSRGMLQQLPEGCKVRLVNTSGTNINVRKWEHERHPDEENQQWYEDFENYGNGNNFANTASGAYPNITTNSYDWNQDGTGAANWAVWADTAGTYGSKGQKWMRGGDESTANIAKNTYGATTLTFDWWRDGSSSATNFRVIGVVDSPSSTTTLFDSDGVTSPDSESLTVTGYDRVRFFLHESAANEYVGISNLQMDGGQALNASCTEALDVCSLNRDNTFNRWTVDVSEFDWEGLELRDPITEEATNCAYYEESGYGTAGEVPPDFNAGTGEIEFLWDNDRYSYTYGTYDKFTKVSETYTPPDDPLTLKSWYNLQVTPKVHPTDSSKVLLDITFGFLTGGLEYDGTAPPESNVSITSPAATITVTVTNEKLATDPYIANVDSTSTGPTGQSLIGQCWNGVPPAGNVIGCDGGAITGYRTGAWSSTTKRRESYAPAAGLWYFDNVTVSISWEVEVDRWLGKTPDLTLSSADGSVFWNNTNINTLTESELYIISSGTSVKTSSTAPLDFDAYTPATSNTNTGPAGTYTASAGNCEACSGSSDIAYLITTESVLKRVNWDNITLKLTGLPVNGI